MHHELSEESTGVLDVAFSSFFAVSGPTLGTVTVPAKLGISCMGLDWPIGTNP